jgi:hypothetical protein
MSLSTWPLLYCTGAVTKTTGIAQHHQLTSVVTGLSLQMNRALEGGLASASGRSPIISRTTACRTTQEGNIGRLVTQSPCAQHSQWEMSEISLPNNVCAHVLDLIGQPQVWPIVKVGYLDDMQASTMMVKAGAASPCCVHLPCAPPPQSPQCHVCLPAQAGK